MFASWSGSFIERRLNRPYIQFICVLVLTVYVAVFAIAFATSAQGRTVFGPSLGADFAAFYVAGKIFNTHSPDRIYDSQLHHQLYQEQFPNAEPDTRLPYVNAPFFILPFTVLARLPYSWAYLCWLVLSLALYLAGYSLIWKTLDGMPRDAWLTALLLALSFMPFLVECLAGGQTSAVGFFSLALAIQQERRGHHVLSGLALSLCAYKPTLLLLVVPMLIITRRYSTFLVLSPAVESSGSFRCSWLAGKGALATSIFSSTSLMPRRVPPPDCVHGSTSISTLSFGCSWAAPRISDGQ